MGLHVPWGSMAKELHLQIFLYLMYHKSKENGSEEKNCKPCAVPIVAAKPLT